MNHVHGSTDAEQMHGRESLRHGVDDLRHLVENVRDRAEIAFRDRPYLVPVAAGALGLGIGVLIGSKLTRFLVFTAIGTMLTESVGGELKRLSREFLADLQDRLSEEDQEEQAGA